MDGTSTTDAAIERKVVAAVKRHATVKVKLSYAETARPRAQMLEALVRKAGVKDLEVTSGIVTTVPPQPPPPAGTTPSAVLAIAANGTLRIGTRVIPDAALDKELAALAKQSPKLVLAPDASTTARVIERLVQRAKAAGFTEVMFTSK